ncbi:MAG: RsmD family RNA methyltransferase, partial [Pseudomonadota bacterium]
MRIIAGRWRGTPLTPLGKGDAGAALRPTPDRVRESLFSMLTSRGALEGARVLDLFAGTGAMALEALSRGAETAVMVEKGRVGGRLIAANIAKLRAEGAARLMRADATRLPDWEGAPFDLVCLDPPYGRDLAPRALTSARAGGWIAPEALVLC